MFQVICPKCNAKRFVKDKQAWMRDCEPPYTRMCKRCCQIGKPKTDECKEKLKQAVKKLQTPEVIEKKRQFMLDHPELWDNLKPELGREAWKGQHHTQESKNKISDGVKKAKGKTDES